MTEELSVMLSLLLMHFASVWCVQHFIGFTYQNMEQGGSIFPLTGSLPLSGTRCV